MLDDALDSLLDPFVSPPQPGDDERSVHIPTQQRAISCCCGNPDCAYLQHNNSQLDGLESQVFTAARLGKALLVRHEAYIADSERERKAMTAHIESLQNEKSELEKQNTSAVEENRNLLDQLESLNNAVAESDTQVLSLQATLRSTQQELQRLSSLAARTEKLEQQLMDFEREQVVWQSVVDAKETSEKSALRRWQEAERTLSSLQIQIERIECEAREEKERHVEVLGRMERRHNVERELDSAAGRLKGAAAVKSAGTEGGGPTVVSHFVKDILQDNANLQMGIIELRDMLQNSNEEVETLRKQLSIHQPIAEDGDLAMVASRPSSRPHLKEEMRRATSSELHVHHHYHAPPAATPKSGSSTIRRTKKKRYGALSSGIYTPRSGASTPRHSFSPGSPTAATILSQTAASLPGDIGKRWSLASNHSYQSNRDFSGPSSPISTNRASSIFDRVFSDSGHDSSRPTTPETEEPFSPVWAPSHSKRSSKSSYHGQRPSVSSHKNRSSLDSILDVSSENLRHLEQQHLPEAVIPEEDEHDWENTDEPTPDLDLDLDLDLSTTSPLSLELERAFLNRSPGRLRRAASHESVLSLAGMDVHTLKSRPSQLLTPHGARSYAPQAVISDATAHAARPAVMAQPLNSGTSILNDVASAQRHASSGQSARQGLGGKVGGWVFGRWGVSPTPSTAGDTISVTPKKNRTVSVASGSTGKSMDEATPKKLKLRPPGINQSGPILGFGPEIKIQHPPIMNTFDADALKNVLGD